MSSAPTYDGLGGADDLEVEVAVDALSASDLQALLHDGDEDERVEGHPKLDTRLAVTINDTLAAAGFGSYPTYVKRVEEAPLMLQLALKRWGGNYYRIQRLMRPWFTKRAWLGVGNLATSRYMAGYLRLFPLNEGDQRPCSHPLCDNGRLVQRIPENQPVTFVLRHSTSNVMTTAFELDHLVEVHDTCARWGRVRMAACCGDTDLPWDTGLSRTEADQILLDLFAPSAYRWRCGHRMPALGGGDCHRRAYSVTEAQAQQRNLMAALFQCKTCGVASANQFQHAAHLMKCNLKCQKCGKSFGTKRGLQIHQRSCL